MATADAGLLVLDKPAGPTSHDVIQQLRRLTGVRRIGHAGTLDPLASGVLLVCLGRAARLLEYLVGLDKTYWAALRLGQTTDTYDAEGQLTAERPVDLGRAEIEAALAAFRGPIAQRPPMYSALKLGGRPLYQLARQGLEVERPPRQVMIHSLDLLDWRPPRLELRLACSSGAYIRSLAHDLGQALGPGAHLAALRREAVGDFGLDEATQPDALTPAGWRADLQPPAAAVR
ncbi:MAG: tRNA pseudouridine(55) synthase TruB, partial [Candidatus Promineifilaceae bacterium]